MFVVKALTHLEDGKCIIKIRGCDGEIGVKFGELSGFVPDMDGNEN